MANYDVSLTLVATNKTDGTKATTSQTYENLPYAYLLEVEKAMAQALIGLGNAKLAAQSPTKS